MFNVHQLTKQAPSVVGIRANRNGRIAEDYAQRGKGRPGVGCGPILE